LDGSSLSKGGNATPRSCALGMSRCKQARSPYRNGVEQTAFLIECRSLSGFGGSPVFVMASDRTFTAPNIPPELNPPQPQPPGSGATVTIVSTTGTFGPWLLGVDCAHLPLHRPVFQRDPDTDKILDDETNFRVDANTGIAAVIPAWRLADVLNSKPFQRERERDDGFITLSKDAKTAQKQQGSPPA
jgi:hypothetical protein